MMKKILIWLWIISGAFLVKAQESTAVLDTLYGNDKKIVAVFFPEPIRKAVVGGKHYTFNYNREEAQHLGLLQALPGHNGNLLAVTTKGRVYCYILKYADSLSKLNYFLDESKSIGQEKPIIEMSVNTLGLDSLKMVYYTKYSKFLLNQKPDRLAFNRKDDLILKLHKLVYVNSELFLVIELTNKSMIDFQVDEIKVHRVIGNKKRKSSYQEIPMDTIFTSNTPKIVKAGESKKFVYVLPKYVFEGDERLRIFVDELNGSRTMHIKF